MLSMKFKKKKSFYLLQKSEAKPNTSGHRAIYQNTAASWKVAATTVGPIGVVSSVDQIKKKTKRSLQEVGQAK